MSLFEALVILGMAINIGVNLAIFSALCDINTNTFKAALWADRK